MPDTPRPARRDLCGLLNLNKPGGMTSRDVVDLVARPLKRAKIKVGHAGTLDPLATGVLVVAVGPATRLVESVQRQAKTYRAVIRLGAVSDTDDADGRIAETPDPRIPSEAEVRSALEAQVGTILQRPPEFSALRVEGRRAYDLARKGEAVALEARPVRIDRIAIVAYAWPRLEIEVDCGAGTYIRSVARDVGEALGCGGLIEALTRSRIGAFRIEDALDPLGTPFSIDTIPDLLRPAIEAVPDLPVLRLDPADVARIVRGQPIAGPPAGFALGALPGLALVDSEGRLVAVAEPDGLGRIWPRRVLAVGPEPTVPASP